MAGYSVPSSSWTVSDELSATTCAFVRMYPSAVRTTPEPTPVAGTENGENPLRACVSDVMVTTDGVAAATTAVRSVASTPVDAPVTAAFGVAAAPVVGAAAGAAPPVRPTTTMAVEPEASVAASSAAAMTEPVRRGRRGSGQRERRSRPGRRSGSGVGGAG